MNKKTFEQYLQNIRLAELIPYIYSVELNAIVSHVFSHTPPTLSPKKIQELYVYVVPRISIDGSCSIIDEPADKPYNLAETFRIASEWKNLGKHPHTIRLWRLKRIVEDIFTLTGVDWFGVYRKVQNVQNNWVLAKESYQGLFSRPEFPLTEEFAKKSNNSTVGLTGKAKVIQDVYNNSGPYYKCDGKVQSEFCLPILDAQNNIIGIIDAESFPKNFFTNERLLQIAKIAFDLGTRNLGI